MGNPRKKKHGEKGSQLWIEATKSQVRWNESVLLTWEPREDLKVIPQLR